MIDWKKPYGTISGVLEKYPKARLEQEGKFYTKDGEFVGPGTEVRPPEPEPDTFPRELRVEQPRRWEIIPDFKGLSLEQARKLHWTHLRQIMRRHGVEYTTLQAAKEFLEQ